MKPRDVYDAPFLRENADIYPIRYFLDGIDGENEGLERQDRVIVREHFDPYIDGSRNASLYSVWFNPRRRERRKENPISKGAYLPVFICKTGGRPDYEHYGRFITDKDYFIKMLSYLKSMEILEHRDLDDVVGIDDDVEGLDVVYCSRINKNDLGPIPHHREAFAKDLRRWSSLGGWPYPPIIGTEKGFPKHGNITLEEKQIKRWERIQSDAKRLVDVDPDSGPILEWAQTEQGTDEIIERMSQHIKMLQEKSGCLTD